jgi:hypothetical protein
MVPEFDSIPISTKTIIAYSNLNLNIGQLFEVLPLTRYRPPIRRKGRMRQTQEPPTLPDGSIVMLKYQNSMRGVQLKPSKKDPTTHKYFRNSITFVMFIDGKFVNSKISKNGKFQITGCKNDTHAHTCVKHVWRYILDAAESAADIYSFREGHQMSVVFVIVMTNIDFNLNFLISREHLDRYINLNTSYIALFEPSFGYTGVNIKMPLDQFTELDLTRIVYDGELWIHDTVDFSTYVESLPAKDKSKLMKKKYTTFLVFHSGNVIMSSFNHKFMREPYRIFTEIMYNNRDTLEEVIKEK